MEKENKDLLIEGAKHFEIDLDEKNLKAFDFYLRELLKWNQKINLTAIRTEREIVLKHFLDSLSVYPHISEVVTLLDIGSGAGFPGIPLKIVRPSLKLTLIDSVQKKIDFQRHILRGLALGGVEVIHARIPDQEIIERIGGLFDGVISRAFSKLFIFLPIASLFVRPGGIILAMKGKGIKEELPYLSEPERLPCKLEKIVCFSLPFTSIRRTLILFRKI
ncbi:MAG: 16S rRNA (guanine(527)-N(7))-methyltransferase RsmG [Thermodesulfobacteriota bacterium]